MHQFLHLDQPESGENDAFKKELRENLNHIITAQTFEAYFEGCRQLGTNDLVVMIDGNALESEPLRDLVFTRQALLDDPTFPSKLREKISVPAHLPVKLITDVFWAVILWNKNVAALAIGVQPLSKGGDA